MIVPQTKLEIVSYLPTYINTKMTLTCHGTMGVELGIITKAFLLFALAPLRVWVEANRAVEEYPPTAAFF